MARWISPAERRKERWMDKEEEEKGRGDGWINKEEEEDEQERETGWIERQGEEKGREWSG